MVFELSSGGMAGASWTIEFLILQRRTGAARLPIGNGHSPVFLAMLVGGAGGRGRRLLDQLLKCIHISAVVAGAVDWRLGDEGGVGQAEVIEQNAEGLFPDHSLSDVLVAVELGAAGGFGVVAVDYFHVVQADGFLQLCQRPVEAIFADDV